MISSRSHVLTSFIQNARAVASRQSGKVGPLAGLAFHDFNLLKHVHSPYYAFNRDASHIRKRQQYFELSGNIQNPANKIKQNFKKLSNSTSSKTENRK
jgi:hypothetical protein